MTDTAFHHISVLLEQTVEQVTSGTLVQQSLLTEKLWFVDCTLGGGGHTRKILEEVPNAYVIGIDRDKQALAHTTSLLQEYTNRFFPIHGTFADVLHQLFDAKHHGTFTSDIRFLQEAHWSGFAGIIMDLGVSSPQLDQAQRGFSVQHDGPLDMRMDQTTGISAAEWLNSVEEKELAKVLFVYGEEPRSRQIARAIIQGRPWKNTLSLAECIRQSSGYKNSKTHPATRSFQAIRIFINKELEQLETSLPLALQCLVSSGRLSIISFHSLEDRIVKRFFKDCSGENAPKDAYGNPLVPPKGKILVRKGISGEEDTHNTRARSARLRTLEKFT